MTLPACLVAVGVKAFVSIAAAGAAGRAPPPASRALLVRPGDSGGEASGVSQQPSRPHQVPRALGPTCARSAARSGPLHSHRCSRGGLLAGAGRTPGSDRGSRDRHPHSLGHSNLWVGPGSSGRWPEKQAPVLAGPHLLQALQDPHLQQEPLHPVQTTLPPHQIPPGQQVQVNVCQRSRQSAWGGQGPEAQALATTQPGSTFTRWLGGSRAGDPEGVEPSQTPYGHSQQGVRPTGKRLSPRGASPWSDGPSLPQTAPPPPGFSSPRGLLIVRFLT